MHNIHHRNENHSIINPNIEHSIHSNNHVNNNICSNYKIELNKTTTNKKQYTTNNNNNNIIDFYSLSCYSPLLIFNLFLIINLESSFNESTLTSRTYTLLSDNKSSTHQCCCCHTCKLKPTILSNSTSNYWLNNLNQLHSHSLSSHNIYSMHNIHHRNENHSIINPNIEHSIHSNNHVNNNICSNYKIELNKTTTNKKQYTTNKRLLTKYNTMNNSYNNNDNNNNTNRINDNLKYYSSVRSTFNHTLNVEDNTHNQMYKRPLLYNMTNHMNTIQSNHITSNKLISSNDRYLSTRSLSSGLKTHKSIEQTTEIDLYKTAMFVIPAPTSNSLPNIQNDNCIKNRLEQLNDYHNENYHHQHYDQHHQHHDRYHRHRQHHRYKETSDSCLNTKSNSKIRTYICKGCGRTTLRRKKLKTSSDYSCLSLDKCSTPHFIHSIDNNHINCPNEYERILYQSPGDYLEDYRYSTISTRKSYTYPNHTNDYHNDNDSMNQDELRNHLPDSMKTDKLLTPKLDCNKIIVDIKPRQMNEADKKHHITQWIQLGTLGDTASSPTLSPLPPDEYQDKDYIIHSSRYSNEDDNDVIAEMNITTDNDEEKDYSLWINSHKHQVKQTDTSYEHYIEHLNVDKEIKKIQIIKQHESLDTNSLNLSRSNSNYTNNSINDIKKYEFNNNSNNYPSTNDNTTNNEISSTKNETIKKQLNIDTNSQNNLLIKETSSFETINEVSPSIEDDTSSSKYNNPNERIITIKDTRIVNKQTNNSSIDKHSPTLSLHMDSDIVKIRAMNSRISSNLSNKTTINDLLLNHNELLTHSTECTTDLYPNLVRTRDTPIPNVKNLVTYFTELIRLHTNVKDVNPTYTLNNINRLKDYDYDVTDNLQYNVLHNIDDNNIDDYELEYTSNISPFLLHHETPQQARERVYKR
ncbi:hypothetical protein MN116_007952 [Schistosoma mekongi]|uniref:Uncharacterized protein n=1 Tax=Schistosoma mekongi TaxID=38744 RepID=A0AAE1Z7Z6_SCHME|nr:hypothetical protein MN116_007952 [Schistosoma mekongi]